MQLLKKVSILFFLSVAVVQASSCCGVGSTQVSSGYPALLPGMFLLQPGFTYSQTNTHDFASQGFNFALAYGVTDHISLSVKSGFSWLQSSLFRAGRYDTINNVIIKTKADTTFLFKNRGITDGLIGTQIVILPMTVLTRQELKVGVDVTLPWSPSEKETKVEGKALVIPARAQTGSGTYGLSGYMVYNRTFPQLHLAALSAFSGRYNLKNDHGRTPSSEIAMLFSAIAGPYANMKPILSAGMSVSGRALDEKAAIDPASGGSRIDLSPAVEYATGENLKLVMNTKLPLWRSMNQRTNGSNFEMQMSLLVTIAAMPHE
ncbi:MAG: hypothetical protein JW795_03125 [Chitinivibrionales bacterium]|nr:hypothetical protein [Chitinivibrionales bacterium]